MRKVCVLIGSRANYGSIKSAMRAIADSPGFAVFNWSSARPHFSTASGR